MPREGQEMIGSMCWIDVATDIGGYTAKNENWPSFERKHFRNAKVEFAPFFGLKNIFKFKF